MMHTRESIRSIHSTTPGRFTSAFEAANLKSCYSLSLFTYNFKYPEPLEAHFVPFPFFPFFVARGLFYDSRAHERAD